jgi:choline dehydrogenase-like flavoprotein
MPEIFDFIVVGGGSVGAVITARLTEDPGCRVALVEAGECLPRPRADAGRLCESSARSQDRLNVPPMLARQYGYTPGDSPCDALLESMALHFAATTYHLSCTCLIGSVADPRLHVFGIKNLRVADASVTPEIISGHTNAASIMFGEKAAEIIARDHGVKLAAFVGEHH